MSRALSEPGQLETLEDRWIFSRLSRTAESVNRALEQHRYHEVAEELWQFFWHDFCDWYLEIKKLRLAPGSGLTNDWRNLLARLQRLSAIAASHPAVHHGGIVASFRAEHVHRAGAISSGGRDR